MNSTVGFGATRKTASTTATEAPSEPRGTPTTAVDATELLPPPFTTAVTDDFAASLAIMMMQQEHDDRVLNDTQARAAAKAQEEAHARKISKMRELADDTFKDGLVDGITDCLSAGATALSAVVRFDGEIDGIRKTSTAVEERGKLLLRNASLIDAGGLVAKATGKFIQTSFKRDQELDRADMAVEDREIDRQKGAADAASTQSRRDQDDIRDTIGAYRSYANAKTQLNQAAIIRG